MRQSNSYQLSNLMYGPTMAPQPMPYIPQYTGPGLTNQSSWGIAPYVPQYTGYGNTASGPLITPSTSNNPYSYQGGYYVAPYEY